jgi:hypothetical protein
MRTLGARIGAPDFRQFEMVLPDLPQQLGSDSAPTRQSPHGLEEFQKASWGGPGLRALT